jgi:ADP-heptose:LPS heptosyltransferase
VTAGAQAAGALPLDRSVPYVYFQPQVLRYLELAALVGAQPVTIEPQFAVTQSDRVAVEPLLADREASRPLVVLHPGATDARRRWALCHFAQVGAQLCDAGAQLVLNGDASERPLCAALLRLLDGRALDLSGELTLHGLVGLLARAALVVANDTGPGHMAAASGTPLISVVGPSNPAVFGPWGPNVTILHDPHWVPLASVLDRADTTLAS